MNKTICVYGASSTRVDKHFLDVARELGEIIAKRKDKLIFGGGMNGLMGAVAEGAHENGAHVVGVIPEALNLKGVVFELCDELIVTKTMRERKAIMDERADAFIALPGGFGTLEELLEIITLKQLMYHDRPIVILNTSEFYTDLIKQFEHCIEHRFAKPDTRTLYFVTKTPAEALEYIDNYKPVPREKKYLDE